MATAVAVRQQQNQAPLGFRVWAEGEIKPLASSQYLIAKNISKILRGYDFVKRQWLENPDVTIKFYSGYQYEGKFKPITKTAEGEGTLTYPNGVKYIGSFKDGFPTGHGKLIVPNGKDFEGDFVDGKTKGKLVTEEFEYEGEIVDGAPHGNGKMFFFDYKSSHEGTFKQSRFADGWVKREDSDGSITEGNLINGHFHGIVTITRKKLGLVQKMEMQEGKFTGNGEMIFKNKDHYVGQILNGSAHGIGKLYGAEGNLIYEGEFFDHAYHGKGKMYLEHGDIYEGDFCKGQMHGKGILRDAEGKNFFKGEFRDGEMSGQMQVTTEGGIFFDGIYESDAMKSGTITFKEGPYKEYTGSFLNTLFHGFGRLVPRVGTVQEGEFFEDKFLGDKKPEVAEQNFAELKAKLERKEAELKAAGQKIDELTAKISQKEKDLVSKGNINQKESNTFKAEIEALKKEKAVLEEAAEANTRELGKLRKEINTKTLSLEQSENNRKGLEAELAKLQKEVLELKDLIRQKEEALGVANNELVVLRPLTAQVNVSEGLRTLIEQKDMKAKEAAQEIQRLNATVAEKLKKIEELESTIEAQKSTIGEFTVKVAKLEKQIEELKAACEKRQTKIQTLETDITRLRTELQTAQADHKSALEAQIKKHEKELSLEGAAKARELNRANELQTKLDEALQANTTLANERGALKAEISQLKQAIEEKENQLRNQTRDGERLSQEVESLKQQKTKLEESLKARAAELQATGQENAMLTVQLRAQISQLEQAIEEKETQLRNKTLNGEELSRKIESLNQEKTSLEQRLTASGSALQAERQANVELEAKLKVEQEEKQKLEEYLGQLENQIADLNGQLADSKDAQRKAALEIARLTEQLLQSQNSAAEIERLNKRIAELTAEKKACEDRIVALDAELRAAQASKAKADVQVTLLTQKLDRAGPIKLQSAPTSSGRALPMPKTIVGTQQKITLPDGSLYVGELQSGVPHEQGVRTFTGHSKFVKFDGIFKEGFFEKGQITYKDGSIYNGDVKNDMRHGVGKLSTVEGEELSGKFENDEYKG